MSLTHRMSISYTTAETHAVDYVQVQDTTFRPGDGVSVKSGRFVRYGTIVELLESPDHPIPAEAFRARIRFGHGTELVRIALVSKL